MTKNHYFKNQSHPKTFWQKVTDFQKSSLIVIGVLALMPVLTVQAVGMTQSATESGESRSDIVNATPSASTTTQLKKRLEKILGDQDASASGEKIAGYIGEITRVSEEALAVKTPKGNQIIPLDESVRILKRDKPLPIKDISVGNWVIVVGTRTRNGDVSPARILVQAASLKPAEHIVSMGTIESVGRSSVQFIPRGQTESLTLNIGKNTKLTDSLGEPLDLKKLPTQVSAIAVALLSSNDNWTISTLKTLVDMDEFKNSTPSPTPTPRTTPSSKPTPTPSSAP